MEIIEFDAGDVIVTSGAGTGGDTDLPEIPIGGGEGR